MSKVEELLNKEYSKFINLHDLLIKITEVDGCSLQKAAMLLYRIMADHPKDQSPFWYRYNEVTGKESMSAYNHDALERLGYVANEGRFESDFDDGIPF
jgi:hypothetical protein